MNTQTMIVTPQMAAEWLTRNTRNRTMNKTAVDALAQTIRDGNWRTTHQGIAFGADGTLYDGQHRLAAIVTSGIAVAMNVSRGLAPEDRDAIDNGGCGTREARHIIQISDGIPVSTNLAACLGCAAQMIRIGTLVQSSRQTANMLRDAIRTHGVAAAAVFAAASANTHEGRSFTHSAITSSLVIAWETEPAAAIAFAQGMRSGAGLPPGSPILALRDFLAHHPSSGGNRARDENTMRTFGAFDAFVRGVPMSKVIARPGARDRYIAAWKAKRGMEANRAA